MTHSLRDVLAAKAKRPVVIRPGASVSEATSLMLRSCVGSVLVVESSKVVGILSQRDTLWRIVQPGLDPRTTTVRDVMTTKVRCGAPETSVETAMWLMTQEGQRQLPVLDGDVLLGVVSIGDLVKWVAEDLDRQVADLSSYVAGPCVARHSFALPPWSRVIGSPLGDASSAVRAVAPPARRDATQPARDGRS